MSSEEIVITTQAPAVSGTSRKAMVRDTALTVGTRAFTYVSIFIKSIIIARALGPEGRGIYALIILVYDLLISYGRMGVNESVVYFAGRKPEEMERYSGNVLTLGIISGAAMIGIMAALDGVLRSTVLEGVSWLPLMLMLSMLPFGMVLTFFNALLQSQRKLVTFNVIYGMASLIHLVAMFVALYVFDAGVLGAVVATMLSVFIPAMVSLARVMLTVRLRPRLDPGIIRELVSFGLKSHAQFVLNATLSKIDLPIMNLYLSPAAVGIYSVAQSLVGRTLNLPTAVSTALYPHMVATESDAEMDGITESACRNLLALVALVAVAAAIIAKPVIVLLFGEEFREAYVPFLLLLIGVVPQGSYQILSRNFASRGRPLIAAIPTAVALIVSVVGDIVLIPRVGINGAAITSALAAILMFVMGLGIYSKLSKRPWWNAVLIQPSDFHAYRRLGKRVGHRVRRLAPRSAG